MDRYVYTDYKFNRGDAITDQEREFQGYVKRNYSGLERTAGSIWESFAHMHTPIHTKFLNIASPLEQYERMELYGRPIRDWGSPYQAFIRPYTTSALSKDTALGGAMSFGMGGLIFGGPVGAVAGSITGAAYGALNPGLGKIPEYRQRERELTAELDRVRYEKAKSAYQVTGSLAAQNEMQRTMTHQYNNATNFWSMYNSVPRHERAFMREFAEAGSSQQRARLREILPDYVTPVLEKAWSGQSFKSGEFGHIMESYDLPSPEWKGWNANISTDDIAVKQFERAGLDAHDVGLGWNNQIRKMRYTQGIPESFSDTQQGLDSIGPGIQSIIESIIPGAQVSVVPTNAPGVSVTVT
jgi:hypothetical protein